MSFSNNEDIMKFIAILVDNLELIDEKSLITELEAWQSISFTTSSEFLGELRLILQKINARCRKRLKITIQQQIDECINSINKAFEINENLE